MSKRIVFDDPDQLQQRIADYFAAVDESRREYPMKNGSVQILYDNPPSVIGLAVYLGVHKDTLYSYMHKEDSKRISDEKYIQISDCLLHARDRIESFTVGKALASQIDSKTAGLILGGFGYAAKTEDKQTVTVKLEGADSNAVADWSR